MLENGMVVNQEDYDVQCQDEATFICDFCGEDVPERDKVDNVDRPLCSSCVYEYCKDKTNKTDIVNSFVNSKEQDYYIGYYFDGLEPREKLVLIKAMYQIHSKGVDGKKDPYFDELEKEFCLENDGFFDFVKEGMFNGEF